MSASRKQHFPPISPANRLPKQCAITTSLLQKRQVPSPKTTMFSLSLVLLITLSLHQQVSAWHLTFEEPHGSPGLFNAPPLVHSQQLTPNQAVFASNVANVVSTGIAELGSLAVQQVAAPAAPAVNKSLNSSSLVEKMIEVAATAVTSPAASPALNVSTEKLGTAAIGSLLKPRKQTNVDSIEQQIINQHAGHLSSSSSSPPHRLLPHKQRDHKVISALSTSAGSDGRDSSPFSTFFDAIRSSATSRSSIVKAISDNKLSRTLSEVGKSISGNKYVAGAAFASALAALGLTVSKLMSPYLFAQTNSGYSKLGAEPLMSSDSLLRPQTMAGFSFPQVPNNLQLHLDAAEQQQQQQYSQADSLAAFNPKPTAKLGGASQPDTNGYYTSYYLQQPEGSADSMAPIYLSGNQYQIGTGDQSELVSSGSQENPVFTSQQQQPPAANRYSTQPSYLSGGSRRLGAIPLKLDESVKVQLYEQLKRQYNQQPQPQPFRLDSGGISFGRANDNRLTADSSQYVTKATKPYASPAAAAAVSQWQQGQQQPSTAKSSHLQPAYLVIRPKTNRLAPEAAPSASPSSQPQSPWRSFEESAAEGGRAQPPEHRQVMQQGGWQSVVSDSSKSAQEVRAAQTQQAHLAPQANQQHSLSQPQQQVDHSSASQSQQQAAEEKEKATNGAALSEQSLQRVSRTAPSTSSVKGNRAATGGLTDYESDTSKQVAATANESRREVVVPQVVATATATTKQPQAITMISRPISSVPSHLSSSSSSNSNSSPENADNDVVADDHHHSKANHRLVQLSMDGNDDDVKLIEANTKSSSSDKLAAAESQVFDSGLLIMLPTANRQHGAQSLERATSMRAASVATGDAQQVALLQQQEQQQDARGKLSADGDKDTDAESFSSGFLGTANHH